MGRKAGTKKVEEKKEEVVEAPAATEPEPAKAKEEPAPAGERVELSEDDKAEMAKYDVLSRMTPFFDRHLIFPLLNALQESGMYNKEDVSKAELKLLSETCMIDFAIDKYNEVGEEVPQTLVDRRAEVLEEISYMRDRVLDFLQLLEDEDRVRRIRDFKSIESMCFEFEIEPALINDLLKYAKQQYDCGNYQLCGELLKHYRRMPQASEIATPELVSCYWGSLACELLLKTDPEEASELILKLDELLDKSTAPKREVLQHRTWLLHWTVFSIFSSEKVDQKILDFFLNEKSLSIISLSCPHLFRYVGATLILQKRLKHLIKDTVWIVQRESNSYSDPVTRFLLALYTEIDYDDAQQELQKCELACKGDYFLAPHWAEFQENARLHIFESYCRIHQCINIQMIAEKLNMRAEEAELWIVKLIQNAKLDARIDSEKSRVVMTKAPPNVYQQVIEKTKNLAFRSTMLVSNLEKN